MDINTLFPHSDISSCQLNKAKSHGMNQLSANACLRTFQPLAYQPLYVSGWIYSKRAFFIEILPVQITRKLEKYTHCFSGGLSEYSFYIQIRASVKICSTRWL